MESVLSIKSHYFGIIDEQSNREMCGRSFERVSGHSEWSSVGF